MHPQNFSILNAESCKEIIKNEKCVNTGFYDITKLYNTYHSRLFVLLSKWEEKLAHLERTCTVLSSSLSMPILAKLANIRILVLDERMSAKYAEDDHPKWTF
jgi:hypothetical protein